MSVSCFGLRSPGCAFWGALFAAFVAACASSERDIAPAPSSLEDPLDAGGGPPEGSTGRMSAASTGGGDAGPREDDVPPGRIDVRVPESSMLCGRNLPVHPPGCLCEVGQTASCWTGPPSQRHVGDCRDGVQTCELGKGQEFAGWGDCIGEVTDCGEPDPPEEVCGCVPGTEITCDEDCENLVFCAPFSNKVCQPDGTWGPCREMRLGVQIHTCINVFNGCLPDNPEGFYIGDCAGAFTCGHPPNEGPPPEDVSLE